jgi:hypothetical protein
VSGDPTIVLAADVNTPACMCVDCVPGTDGKDLRAAAATGRSLSCTERLSRR